MILRNLIAVTFINLLCSCDNDSITKTEIWDKVLKSQNYSGEIIDLIIYALLTIFLFFIIGYIGNKTKK